MKKDKCPNCGAKKTPGYGFCLSCGQKFVYEIQQIQTVTNKVTIREAEVKAWKKRKKGMKILRLLILIVFLPLILALILGLIWPELLQIIFVIILISILIFSLPSSAFLFYINYRKPRVPSKSVDYHRPLVQNRRQFLKVQPFFCDNCKKFTDTFREYCENCGTGDSLRKAKKEDFKQYIRK